MGTGPVMEPARKRRPNWKLKPPHDGYTQGLVVSGFVSLPCSKALFLSFDWDAPDPGSSPESRRGAWLTTLDSVAQISDADGKDDRAAALAFTWSGLQRLGLPPDALESFSGPFKEGMYQEDRLRRLGDRIDGKWQPSVIDGGPLWSGNIPPRDDRTPDRALPGASSGTPSEEVRISTPKTVHALLMLYEETEAKVEAWAAEVESALSPLGITAVHRLSLSLRLDANNVGREHFGFADGLSQPVPFSSPDGLGDESVVLLEGQPATRDPWHGVPLGEILFGHTDAHHEKAPGPIVAADPEGKLPKLEPDGAPEGFLNLGLDGSYMVVRELRQDVAAFWKSITEGSARIQARDPTATHATPKWLAENIIGRDTDGHLLCPKGRLAADEYNFPQNAFGFLRTDPHGVGCPPGSHVRRANPRDALAKDEASAQTLLDAANNHRILRRGRKYGDDALSPEVDDGKERGLLFICLNTDIARQFEFVQQTWLLNCNFATLFDETDPLVGPKGRFTIREQPLRRTVDVETFVRMAGGEYFFLPSLPALRYLAAL
jgi:Dyp-type peroxidase family